MHLHFNNTCFYPGKHFLFQQHFYIYRCIVKDVLTSKSISQLEDIAKEIGAEIKSDFNHEEIIYAILDRQAVVEGNKKSLGTTRKRTRIAKKETDRVYSVNGKEGENFDVKKNKKSVEQPSFI